MAELRIPIIVENKGKKAFGEANKGVNTLDKSVSRLGKSLAAVFGAQQLLKFGKNAAKAFIEDQREATRLAMAVKNLGIAFEAPAIEDYIGKLSRLSGVTDSELRPAMQTLLQITGSVTESQKILAQSLDVAAATGIDVATVAEDIGRAYTGNTRGLRKYNLGLTQAELTTSNYADIQAKLNQLFAGSNAAQLQTYAGQMSLLSVAAGEASETIGKGLIDAMITVTDSKDVTDFVNKIDSVALRISNAIGSISRFIQVIKLLPSATGSDDPRFRAIFDPARNAEPLTSSNVLSVATLQKQQAQLRKTEADALKRQKELAALQKKGLDAQKKQNALTKASKTIDLDRIGMTAALRGKISESDRLSLQLQLALLDKNDAAATKLSAELEASIKRQNALNAALAATPEAPNPFRNWVLPMDLLNYTAASLGTSVAQLQAAPIPPSSSFSDAEMELAAAVNSYRAADQQAIKVEVYLDNQVVGGAVTDVQQNQSLSGTFNTVNRGGRFGNIAL
jgi:hypothetical protein